MPESTEQQLHECWGFAGACTRLATRDDGLCDYCNGVIERAKLAATRPALTESNDSRPAQTIRVTQAGGEKRAEVIEHGFEASDHSECNVGECPSATPADPKHVEQPSVYCPHGVHDTQTCGPCDTEERLPVCPHNDDPARCPMCARAERFRKPEREDGL